MLVYSACQMSKEQQTYFSPSLYTSLPVFLPFLPGKNLLFSKGENLLFSLKKSQKLFPFEKMATIHGCAPIHLTLPFLLITKAACGK